jgi:hypothetical protein
MLPTRRVVPCSRAGWVATLGLVLLEFAGAFLLILVPELRHEPVGWDRALGWFLLSAGSILFFILFAQSRSDASDPGDRDQG